MLDLVTSYLSEIIFVRFFWLGITPLRIVLANRPVSVTVSPKLVLDTHLGVN